jgi:hypothetical protein
MPSFNTLVDDFEDGVLDTSLWSASYGDPDETGGRARIPCTTGYAGLKSGSAYSLTDAGIVIRLHAPTPGGATTAAASVLVLTSTGGTDGGFIIDPAQNAIGLYLREGYADGGAVFLTYSPTDHAWLRFREEDGSVYWDTSPDGTVWTNRRTSTSPAWAADTDLAFLIEGHRDAGTPDFIEVESVNAPLGQTVEGTASLSAAGGLTVVGRLRAHGSTTLAAAGTLTAAGVRRQTATVGLAAAGTATAVGVLRACGSGDLASTSTLAAVGARRATGTMTATAASTLTASGRRNARAASSLAASSSLTVAEAAIDWQFSIDRPALGWEVGAPWL